MRLFWREHRLGQRLILQGDDSSEEEAGAVRKTPRGFDALAKTMGYDPGRAAKGLASLEEAKAFVESFHPWDLFEGTGKLAVEQAVQPAKEG
ncbi:MAG: hypothetical protein EXR48_02095 [Dehalococcoidia bacterium]|nr:hypothetical protein [Dehalococcoidia bacterium]